RAAVVVSTEPSAPNGVTIAVSRVPRRAGASNPTVLTVFRLPGGGKLFSTYRPACVRVRRLRLHPSRFGGQRAGGDLGAVGQGGDLEVGEHGGGDVGELAQTLDGQPPDFDVGVLAGPHGDEVPPGPVVP